MFTNNHLIGLKVKNYTTTSTVTAGTGAINTITPPKGEIWVIRNIGVSVASAGGTTTGNHSVRFFYDATDITDLDNDISLYLVQGAHDSAIQIDYFRMIGNDSEKPENQVEQVNALFMGGMIATNSIPIDIIYWNGTDGDQANDIYINVVVEIYKEVL